MPHLSCLNACAVQTMRVDTMDLFAQERDREVRNILKSINDLAQIMKDLSVLVIDQGTIVDRIDYNMEQVCVNLDRCASQPWAFSGSTPNSCFNMPSSKHASPLDRISSSKFEGNFFCRSL